MDLFSSRLMPQFWQFNTLSVMNALYGSCHPRDAFFIQFRAIGARTGTSAEMGVEVVQRSLSSSGTGRPVPERGASHDPVLELDSDFGPSSGTGTNSPGSRTGTDNCPSSRTGTVPVRGLTYTAGWSLGWTSGSLVMIPLIFKVFTSVFVNHRQQHEHHEIRHHQMQSQWTSQMRSHIVT